MRGVDNEIALAMVKLVVEGESTLPSYKNPPVVEVSVGIQLANNALTTAHLGAYWASIKQEYPLAVDAPGPIIPTVESQNPFEPRPQLGLDAVAQPRIWLSNAGGDQLLQLQRDRFVSNWKKVPDQPYPRFAKVYEAFDASFSHFSEYCEAESLPLVPNQYEVSYINHIYEGKGWTKETGVGAVLDGTLFGKPDVLDARIGYPLGDHAGRLHVRLAIGRNNETLQRLVAVEITARGFHKNRNDWFETAHRAIVTKFAELTNPDVQKTVWLREDE